MSTVMTDATSDCALFAREFEERWDMPTADKLCELLLPDVRLVQPASPPVVGRDNAHKMFTSLFNWLPDMRAEVDQWRGGDDVLYIEFRLMATFGGQHVAWPVVDRFTLKNDMAAERVSFFDPTTIMGAVLRHPTVWPGFLRTKRSS